MNMKKGFTLVELVAVIALIAIIATYLTVKLTQYFEDSKISVATSFLSSSVPNAIETYRSRNLGSCRNLSSNDDVYQVFRDRGLGSQSAWDESWFAVYDDESRNIIVSYPIVTRNIEDVIEQIGRNLVSSGVLLVDQVSVTTSEDITVVDPSNRDISIVSGATANYGDESLVSLPTGSNVEFVVVSYNCA